MESARWKKSIDLNTLATIDSMRFDEAFNTAREAINGLTEYLQAYALHQLEDMRTMMSSRIATMAVALGIALALTVLVGWFIIRDLRRKSGRILEMIRLTAKLDMAEDFTGDKRIAAGRVLADRGRPQRHPQRFAPYHWRGEAGHPANFRFLGQITGDHRTGEPFPVGHLHRHGAAFRGHGGERGVRPGDERHLRGN